MNKSETHIIGAGLSGLSAAVALTASGYKATLYESSPQAGGRCRSFWDHELNSIIDNGNHLILGSNKSVFAYLKVIGNESGLIGQSNVRIPFIDLRTGKRWAIRPNYGKIPWWIFSDSRRVPNSSWFNYLSILKLMFASNSTTVKECLGGNTIMSEMLWEPLTKAVLNTEMHLASAKLLWPVIKIAFGNGAKGSQPFFAREGLSSALIDPAIDFITKNNGSIKYGCRLKDIEFNNKKAISLNFGEYSLDVGKKNQIIIAVPPHIASQLLPDILYPSETRSILNAHFRPQHPIKIPGKSKFLGIVGGTADWVFLRDRVLSVTVSAADELIDEKNELLAKSLWKDLCTALSIQNSPLPPFKIVKEKRATFAQTAGSTKSRPNAKTPWKNVILAGDWTNTGLPATIEGSVKSGLTAAIRARRKM